MKRKTMFIITTYLIFTLMFIGFQSSKEAFSAIKIVKIKPIIISIKQGKALILPKTVVASTSNGSNVNIPVIWKQPLKDTSKAGKYKIIGTVKGYNKGVELTVNIEKYIISINNIEMNITQEEKYTFPETIDAKISDGSIASVPIKWNSETLNTNDIGVYTFVGEVKGYSNRPLLTVKVNSNKLSVKEISAFKNAIVSVLVYDHHGNYDGSGSGFAVSADGIIVTCYHVINGDQDCKVVLENGKSYDVESVLNYNKDKDIAVLKLKDAKDLPFIKLGDSDKSEIGEEVVAIGNPEGFQNTVSSGVLSGLNRKSDLRTGNDIQFTAGITHGSSGGALFNMKGQVVGMTYSGYDSGDINLAIPSNDIVPFFEGGTPTTIAALNPLTADDKNELQLEKMFPEVNINGHIIKLNDIYLTINTKTNEVIADIIYSDDSYDNFINYLSNAPAAEIAVNKQLYEQWLSTIYAQIKSYYPGKIFTGYIDGQKSFTDKPSENDFTSIEFNRISGKWDAYVVLSIFGDDDNNKFAVQWRPKK